MMLWFLIVVLAVVVVLSLLAVLILSAPKEEGMSEQELLALRVRQAERQWHDAARDGFVAMLDEARSGAGR
jgi:hypothetical protein